MVDATLNMLGPSTKERLTLPEVTEAPIKDRKRYIWRELQSISMNSSVADLMTIFTMESISIFGTERLLTLFKTTAINWRKTIMI